MYQLSVGNKKVVLLLHEIYGINANIKQKCNALHELGFDVYCPNLLSQDKIYSYQEEEKAYSDFIACIGFSQACQNALITYKDLESRYDKVFIVGYSIGATIAWMMSEYVHSAGIVCFYGSRIRDYTDIIPLSPMFIFFASNEKFNVEALVKEIEEKKNIEVLEMYKGYHGFADPYCHQFNYRLYLKTKKIMLRMLKENSD